MTAAAPAPTTAHVRAYDHAYHAAARRFGARAPGRNIIRDGLSHGRLTDRIVVRSLGVLQRMLKPPVPTRPVAPLPAPGATATASVGTGGLPACASESGTNYSTGSSNTNASSGATGRYQIIPSTAAAYGCSLATPAGQDACAQTIYRHQGAGAWTNC